MKTLLRMIMITNPQLFNQIALHDLIRDLDYQNEFLGSRLQERNLLAPGTTFYRYRSRERP